MLGLVSYKNSELRARPGCYSFALPAFDFDLFLEQAVALGKGHLEPCLLICGHAETFFHGSDRARTFKEGGLPFDMQGRVVRQVKRDQQEECFHGPSKIEKGRSPMERPQRRDIATKRGANLMKLLQSLPGQCPERYERNSAAMVGQQLPCALRRAMCPASGNAAPR